MFDSSLTNTEYGDLIWFIARLRLPYIEAMLNFVMITIVLCVRFSVRV